MRIGATLLLMGVLAWLSPVEAAPVRVRMTEGAARGFLVVQTGDGETIGHGELLQKPLGALVDSRLTLHFQDGSLWDEDAVFSQRRVFRLERYHLRQHGPSFPTQVVSFDRKSGRYDATTQAKPGDAEEHTSGAFKMPDDLYNGLALVLLRNMASTTELSVQTAVFTPAPRLVTTVLQREGEESVTIAGAKTPVIRYVMKMKLGGLTGLVAPLVGKEPPDVRFWMVGGDVPTFAKFNGAMFLNGPAWLMEQAVPRWSK